MQLIQWTLTVLCVFGAAIVSAEEPSGVSNRETDLPEVLLQYRFKAGEEWHYSLSEKGAQTSLSPGLTQVMSNNSSQLKHYRVVQVEPDGTAVLEVIVDHCQLHFGLKISPDTGKPQETEIVYDTAKDEVPPRGLEGVRKFVGKPIARFHMSPAGAITDLEYLQATETPQLKQTEQRKGLPIAFPAEPISVGKSWSDKIEVELQLDSNNPKLKHDFSVQTIYQLKAVKDGVAEISLNTIVQPRPTDPVLRGKLMQYQPQGTIRFDIEEGRILSRTEVVDRRELGVGGPKTAMVVESRKEETLIDPERPGLAN